MIKYLQLIRIKHWIKNIFIFVPLFFAGQFFVFDINLIKAFFAFSFMSSCIYILNDIHDKSFDINHKTKSERPIANGSISISKALQVAALMFILACITGFNIIIYLLVYAFLAILYTYFLKNYTIIDAFTIAFLYILRLFVGSYVSNVNLSNWIIIMTFLLALFFAFSKRYDDINNQNNNVRTSLTGYNSNFLANTMSIMTSVIIISYVLYTLSPATELKFNCNYLFLTSLFVLYGFLRYLQIVFVHKKSDSPVNIIYCDNLLKLDIILWIISFIWIIY